MPFFCNYIGLQDGSKSKSVYSCNNVGLHTENTDIIIVIKSHSPKPSEDRYSYTKQAIVYGGRTTRQQIALGMPFEVQDLFQFSANVE